MKTKQDGACGKERRLRQGRGRKSSGSKRTHLLNFPKTEEGAL